MSEAIRIQVAVNDVLQAEVIVADYATANRVWAQYACARHAAGKPMGGAIMQRADLPRHWDAPVGSSLLVELCSWCPETQERTAALKRQGRTVSHGICETHAAEFMGRR